MPEISDSVGERFSTKSAWANRIVSAVLGIIVTVIGALILGKLQEREPHLLYSGTESLPFSGSNGEVSIYQITLTNDGKREVYDVACSIRIAGAKIEQHRLTANPLLNVSSSISSDSAIIQVPSLNPSEAVQLSLLATGHNLPIKPEITARGRGVIGTEKSGTNQSPSSNSFLWISLAAASFAVASSAVFMRILRSNRGSPGSGDDQRQVLSYLCRMYGLRDLADQYSAQNHETTYWAEADRLGQLAIDNAQQERANLIERVLLGLIEYKEVATGSKAIIYYNVALIKRAKNDNAAAQTYLSLAEKTSKAEIARRLKIDPRFKS